MMRQILLHIAVPALPGILLTVILITGCGPQQGTRDQATDSQSNGRLKPSTQETSQSSTAFPETSQLSTALQENSPDSDLIRNVQYAEKFELDSVGDLVHLAVLAPWQNASGTRFNYLLGNDPALVPDSLSNIPFIATPVEKTVIMSTTFIGFLDTLGVAPTITGVSGGDYIYDEQLLQRYRSGAIREVGYDQQMNYELLLELDPDVVFLFGVQSGIVQTVNKLQDAGIPVVICADYLEPHPLGRAEWIKFFAAFYDKQELAADIFREVAYRYDSIATMVATRTLQGDVPAARPQEVRGTPAIAPDVMLGLPWKDTWYVAGGASFAARLISDAGGAYLFSDHDHAEAKPYDIETVFSRAMEAEVWINPGVASSLDEILEHDRRFGKLDVFSEGAIYNNNRCMGAGGGNDYWESGVIRPDLVLQDLVHIFNHRPVDNNNLFYYRKLK
ncbi:MAG: ABC transporter substrate-binding protein [Bacteroidales bacterium]|nr:ABC transporter substrate-binding protein [Bacteroidales bacterium]